MFGCLCYVHVPATQRDKLSPRSTKCLFIGYSVGKKGYKCYDPSTKQILVSRDVIFHETKPYYQGSNTGLGLQGESPESDLNPTSTPLPIPPPDANLDLREIVTGNDGHPHVIDPDPLPPPHHSTSSEPGTPPIALRKGTRTINPIQRFVSYDPFTCDFSCCYLYSSRT